MHRLWRASIWHPDAIPPDEWKYRSLKRFWLPAYDLLAIWAGIDAVLFGSRLLSRLLGGSGLIGLVGITFSIVAFACLLGVAFPRLWPVEMVGKVILVGMITAYAVAIVVYPAPAPPTEPPNFFIMRMLSLTLPLALFRLTLLGEEWKERRAEGSPA
jgi:hypothetical protein